MIKFWIVNRPFPGQTKDQLDYEWGIMHLSIMMSTRSSIDAFQRYTQHRSVDAVDDSALVIPRSDMEWYGIADHWVEDFETLGRAFTPEYARRAQPHNFADSAFVLELTTGEVVFDQPEPFTGRGGAKLVQFLRPRTGISLEEFLAHWRGPHADLLRVDAEAGGPVRRYVQNPQLPLDPAFFAGTLFEMGGCQTYMGIEELWFDDLDALEAWGRDTARRDAIRTSLSAIADLDGSFAMPVVERVVFDKTLPGTPVPAILNPDSFESLVAASEPEDDGWRTVRPVTSAVAAL